MVIFHAFAQKLHGRICTEFGFWLTVAEIITCDKFLAIGKGTSNLWVEGSKISASRRPRQRLSPLILCCLYTEQRVM